MTTQPYFSVSSGRILNSDLTHCSRAIISYITCSSASSLVTIGCISLKKKRMAWLLLLVWLTNIISRQAALNSVHDQIYNSFLHADATIASEWYNVGALLIHISAGDLELIQKKVTLTSKETAWERWSRHGWGRLSLHQHGKGLVDAVTPQKSTRGTLQVYASLNKPGWLLYLIAS